MLRLPISDFRFPMSPSVPRRQEHRIDEQQFRRFRERPVVGILSERDHVAAARWLVHQERALREQWLRFFPDQAGGHHTIRIRVNTDVSPASSFSGAKTLAPS